MTITVTPSGEVTGYSTGDLGGDDSRRELSNHVQSRSRGISEETTTPPGEVGTWVQGYMLNLYDPSIPGISVGHWEPLTLSH